MKKSLRLFFIVSIVGKIQGMHYLPEKNLLEKAATSGLALATFVYGGWNGIMYGINWSLSTKETANSTPTMPEVFKKVVAPLTTGVVLMLTELDSIKK